MDYREKVDKSWASFKKERGIEDTISGADFMDYEHPLPQDGDTWGIWQYDAKTLVLFTREPYRYEIDLEACMSSAEVLDWIFQLAGKTWMNAEQLGNLIYALDDIIDPQATLCSGGRNKLFKDISKYLRANLKTAKAQSAKTATAKAEPKPKKGKG